MYDMIDNLWGVRIIVRGVIFNARLCFQRQFDGSSRWLRADKHTRSSGYTVTTTILLAIPDPQESHPTIRTSFLSDTYYISHSARD